MTVWPNIVNELTKDNNEELLDVNKWITEVSIFFFFNYVSSSNII